MRRNKNTSKIILAVIVAFLATMLSYSAFSNMQNELSEQKKLIDFMQKNKPDASEEFAYAVSTNSLKAGEIVADSDVDFQNFVIKDITAFENRSDVVNKILLKDISSGEVFTSAHIAKISNEDVTLRDGHRALSLPAENFQGKSETMKVGSFVDIYSASSESSWVLENVRIMSFEGGETESSDESKLTSTGIMNASTITFEVPAENISDFITNVSKSKLVLVKKGANDKKTVVKKPKMFSGYSGGAMSSLQNLPVNPPVSDFGGGESIGGVSGLPAPIQPVLPQNSVELIEANVKSKVTFD